MIEIILTIIFVIFVIGYAHLMTMTTRDRYLDMEDSVVPVRR